MSEPVPDSWTHCEACGIYVDFRMPAVYPHVMLFEIFTGEHRALILRRLMRGVHARHLAGLPILPERAA